MEQIRIGVSSLKQAWEVSALHALPVFALPDWSFSGLTEISPEKWESNYPYGVLLNRILREEDLPALKQLLAELEEMDQLELIYYADHAVFALAGDNVRRRLVYRPETLLTSTEDSAFWMSCGIGGVSISPLLTIEELCHITEQVPEAEVQLHGHLIMSVSGRRLLSAWCKRYQTALPEGARISLQEATRSDRFPIVENRYGTIIFTDYVLDSFDYLPELLKHGASCFYIDGSFLEPDDLISAVKLYQKLLGGEDAAAELYAWRKMHPECGEGYYGQETIL